MINRRDFLVQSAALAAGSSNALPAAIWRARPEGSSRELKGERTARFQANPSLHPPLRARQLLDDDLCRKKV